ncbi:MAG: hypothetical protein CL920_27315 [Deltaproteobacteria bacterium]|nr:hypothetical protein [Deltaproteobacteria bacterium]MBU52421.1 hypothetical protein [Deltaproteobacteria bacterium]|tara:strand:- start:4814 stop:6016 length:1203 start_codon:yes stop_codon:yes gene_type:complete
MSDASQQAKDTTKTRWQKGRPWLSLFLILPSALLSTLLFFPPPNNALWLASVLITEAGVYLSIIVALGCLCADRQHWSGQPLLIVGLIVIGALLSPWPQAFSLSSGLELNISEQFSSKGMSGPQAPGQTSPLMPQRILGLSAPGVTRTSTHIDVPGKALLLDLYKRKGTGKEPLLVHIHGGAWRKGTPRIGNSMHRYLAARGVKVAAISYRFAPKYKFPTQLDDVTTSLKWLRKNAAKHNIDPTRIVLMGRSAGGHLATLAGYRHVVPGIKGVINFYGPIDLHWGWAHPSNPKVIDSRKVLGDFLGGSPKQAKKAFDDASPIKWVDQRTPPSLLIFGTRDPLVSPKHGKMLSSTLSKARIKHVLLELPWATHGCDVIATGPCGQLSLYAIERFLHTTLKL